MDKETAQAISTDQNDHVLMVCQVFHPDTQSTSQLFSPLIAELVARGHKVTVLSGFPAAPASHSIPSREVWQGVDILRGGARNAFKRSLLRRALAYASYSWFVVRTLWRIPRATRIFVVTNPPFAPVLVGLIARLRRMRCTIMLLDVFPDGLVALGHLSADGVWARLWRAGNRAAFRTAQEVWVLGRDMAELIETKYAVPAERVRFVPHWSAVEVAVPAPAKETRAWRKLGLGDNFVVQYSGNMGLWHDMETIVRAAALLQDRPELRFLFIGDGRARAGAERLAQKLSLTNITWLPFQDHSDLADSLACCHLALISQKEGLEGVAVPCKLYGILASGRAVLAQVPARSEVDLVLEEEQCGLVVPPGDATALAAAISGFLGRRSEVEEMGARAFGAYRAKYTLEVAVATFDRLWRAQRFSRAPAGPTTIGAPDTSKVEASPISAN